MPLFRRSADLTARLAAVEALGQRIEARQPAVEARIERVANSFAEARIEPRLVDLANRVGDEEAQLALVQAQMSASRSELVEHSEMLAKLSDQIELVSREMADTATTEDIEAVHACQVRLASDLARLSIDLRSEVVRLAHHLGTTPARVVPTSDRGGADGSDEPATGISTSTATA